MGVGRFEHGDFCKVREKTRILFVLRGIHAGVVGDDRDETSDDAGVRKGHERVGGDVESDEFHRRNSARSRRRGACRRFKGDLFIRRPFAVNSFAI